MMLKRRKVVESSTRRRAMPTAQRPTSFSYRASRSDQEYNTGRTIPRDQDVRRRELVVRFWRQRLGVLLGGLLIIFCVFDILHLSPNPKVNVLSPTASQTFLRDSSVYQQAASKLLGSSLLNSNKITVDTSGVQKKLQHQFPELADVTITLPLISHRPVVYLSPVAPGMILNSGGDTYVLSNSGVALLTASQVTAATKQNLPIVTDQTNHQVKLGTEALSSSDISFIKTVVGELKAKSIDVNSLTLPPAAYELDVHLNGAPYYVKFNMHDATGARQQAGTFLAVHDRLQQQGITPGEYIDVRLDGRAYYK